jgi:hypothetical protein
MRSMNRFQRSFRLLSESLEVVRADRSLLLFPVLSAVFTVAGTRIADQHFNLDTRHPAPGRPWPGTRGMADRRRSEAGAGGWELVPSS